MKRSHTVYARARQAVLDAQNDPDADNLAAAHDQLRQAEADVADELSAAWDANAAAFQAAKTELREAYKTQAQVETACGQAARRRNPTHPVLDATEIARVAEARQAVADARAAHTLAAEQVKAGVTAEQLAES